MFFKEEIVNDEVLPLIEKNLNINLSLKGYIEVAQRHLMSTSNSELSSTIEQIKNITDSLNASRKNIINAISEFKGIEKKADNGFLSLFGIDRWSDLVFGNNINFNDYIQKYGFGKGIWNYTGAYLTNRIDSCIDYYGDSIIKSGRYLLTPFVGIYDIAESIVSGEWNWEHTNALRSGSQSLINSDDTGKRVIASMLNIDLSLCRGLVGLVEALGDTAIIVSGGIGTVGTGISDIIDGAKSGKWDWTSTNTFWTEDVMSIVAYDWSEALDDKIGLRRKMDEYAYDPFKSYGKVCKVSEEVGYIAGLVALTTATCGVAGISSTASVASIGGFNITAGGLIAGGYATTAGIGKHTGEAWDDGANIGSGLAYGATRAVIDGVEMIIGYGVNSLEIVEGVDIGHQLINSGAHILMDVADGAVGSLLDPVISMIYEPNEVNKQKIMSYVNYDSNGRKINDKKWEDLSFTEKYDATFKAKGGWDTVVKNAGAAGAMSAISEIPEIAGSFIDSPKAPSKGDIAEDDISEVLSAVDQMHSLRPGITPQAVPTAELISGGGGSAIADNAVSSFISSEQSSSLNNAIDNVINDDTKITDDIINNSTSKKRDSTNLDVYAKNVFKETHRGVFTKPKNVNPRSINNPYDMLY